MDENQTAIEQLRTKYLSQELVDLLTQPTPFTGKDSPVRYRKARGGSRVAYVPSTHFITRLNDCFGFLWSFENKEPLKEGDQIVSGGRLTVHIPILKKKTVRTFMENGKEVTEESQEFEILNVSKEQFGSSEVKKYSKTEIAKDRAGNTQKDDKGNAIIKHRAGDVIDLGDDFKAAATDSLKKCATHFGIYLDVYRSSDKEEGGKKGQLEETHLEVFYDRANEAGMNNEEADKWAEEQIGKEKEEWEAVDLMALVPELIKLKAEKEAREG